MAVSRNKEKLPLGWREWVALPAFGVKHVKAKVDTGARTSSLHAFDISFFERDGERWVRFEIHPWQRSTEDAETVEAKVIEVRHVKSSSGTVDERPVIATDIVLAGVEFETELTLTNRDEMGFRMLIGRQALRRRFLVDSGASYLGGKPKKSVRRKNRGVS